MKKKCVLKRTNQWGGYVTNAGSKSSYSKFLHKARVFNSVEEAEANRCKENEIICYI